MRIVREYVTKREYKGKTIEVKVLDGFDEDKRVTLLYCAKYHPSFKRLEDSSTDRVRHEIECLFRDAKKQIDDNGFVKKIFKK